MNIDFDKHLYSTGTHYISNSGKDENGAYHGGKAGDQTGHEWELKAWYNRPWTVILRYPDYAVARKIAELAIAAALNNKIGYDQYERTSYWTQLKAAKFDPSKITTPCEDDCTAGVSANVRAAGYIFNIQALKDIPICSSRDMRAKFTKAGFKALTASKYLTGYNYLLPGDILLCENHHAATNITIGSKVIEPPIEEITIELKPEVNIDTVPTIVGFITVKGNYNVRTESNKSARSIGVAKSGEKIPYLGINQNGWNEVWFKEEAGWISSKAGDVEELKGSLLSVVRGSWNVRAEANAESEKLGVVNAGDQLMSTGKQTDGWYEVEYKDSTGWVSKKAF